MGTLLTEDQNFEETPPLAAGRPAPDFELQAHTGEKWRLSDHSGEVLVLLFYPKNETLVCTRQLCSLRDNWANYLEAKAQIVGISAGSVEEHRSFAQKYNLPISLLADTNREVTKKYSFHWLFPTVLMRGIVVVDAQGLVRSRKVMLRAFRPSDRSVITLIHQARADALRERYAALTETSSEKIVPGDEKL